MVDPAKRFSIEGKSVIVTGASGAMGSEAAKALGAAGANVTLAGTNVAVLEELCALPELTGRSTIVARRLDELADAEVGNGPNGISASPKPPAAAPTNSTDPAIPAQPVDEQSGNPHSEQGH
jgi:NAD(P)-dependent dehydrogenase (short-subunit alcohol dehydrogenase family)